jgi:hypothetical protein
MYQPVKRKLCCKSSESKTHVAVLWAVHNMRKTVSSASTADTIGASAVGSMTSCPTNVKATKYNPMVCEENDVKLPTAGGIP